MNQFRKHLARQQNLAEADVKYDTKKGDLIYDALDKISQVINSLYQHAQKSGVSPEDVRSAKELASQLSTHYDRIVRDADRGLQKLKG